MKKLTNVNEALVFLLKRQYDAECLLKDALQACSKNVKSAMLKAELQDYGEASRHKIIKLERAFNYLMTEPTGEKNIIMRKMITETHAMLEMTKSDETRDVMILSCVQGINQYKIAIYRAALALAIEMQLDQVTEFLNEIIEWERKTATVFNKTIFEYNYVRL
jgi:ferritin-like metal-binding protein YciE